MTHDPRTARDPQPSKMKQYQDFPGGPVVKNSRSNAGDAGLIPGRGTKIPHAAGQLIPRTTTTELAHLNESPRAANYRAHAPWSPHATTRERKPGCHNEEPTPQ